MNYYASNMKCVCCGMFTCCELSGYGKAVAKFKRPLA